MAKPVLKTQSEWSGAGGPRHRKPWTLTQWLIAINITCFVAELFYPGTIVAWGSFEIEHAIWKGQIWRFITFQFLHAGVSHILFNMLALYVFGQFLEPRMSRRMFIAFYLLCGCAGAVTCWVLSLLGLKMIGPQMQLIGASAGVLGVIAAAARLEPKRTVNLWMFFMPPIAMRLITLAGIYVGLAVFSVIAGSENRGGQASHLGGAILGYFLIKPLQSRSKWPQPKSRFWKPGDPGENILREEFRR